MRETLEQRVIKAGIVPGAVVRGLFVQTVRDVYGPAFTDAETITEVKMMEGEELVVVKTRELTKLTEIETENGTKAVKAENRQYTIAGTDMLQVTSNGIVLPVIGRVGGKAIKIEPRDTFFESEFTTIDKELAKTFAPFVNYVKTNRERLDDIMDVSTIKLEIDGLSYDMEAVERLVKMS